METAWNVADADDVAAGSEGMHADVGAGPSGGMQETTMSIAERSDAIVNFVGRLLTTYGWTVVFLAVVWFNCKDSVRRRWQKWQNERSTKHANRPERRAVLDRERERAVARRQAEADKAASAHEQEISRKIVQNYMNAVVKDD